MKTEYSKALGIFLALLLQTQGLAAQNLPDFTALVEQNAPAIVNVSTTRTVEEPAAVEGQPSLEELLKYLYGDRMPEFELPEPGDEERSATGSGFIIAQDGYIVTNHHVIADADKITITLNDQREFQAAVVGSDERSDLALLKIEASGLPAVKLGSSASLKVGEWVLAIGSPFGLQYSVAAGIISYMGRSLPSDGGNYVSYIQTDVAINPGHSGGPLFNLAGEVVGINSQIFTNSGGSIGLSFAIPVDVARNVVGQLRENGSVSRGWIGVSYEDVSQELAEAFNLDTPHGALINRVIEGSPAEAAGIRVGDIVVAFESQYIRTGADLPYYVGLVMPDTAVQIDIIRNGDPRTLRMTVGRLDGAPLAVSPPDTEERDELGLVVSALDDETRMSLGIESGVLVEEAEGVAGEAGLRAGDVIISLNNVELNTADDLARLVPELPTDRALPVLVARGERQSFFTIRLPE